MLSLFINAPPPGIGVVVDDEIGVGVVLEVEEDEQPNNAGTQRIKAKTMINSAVFIFVILNSCGVEYYPN